MIVKTTNNRKNERSYNISLRHSQVRELQEALLYHIDSVMIPFYENMIKEGNNFPLPEMERRIKCLQSVLDILNKQAGQFTQES